MTGLLRDLTLIQLRIDQQPGGGETCQPDRASRCRGGTAARYGRRLEAVFDYGNPGRFGVIRPFVRPPQENKGGCRHAHDSVVVPTANLIRQGLQRYRARDVRRIFSAASTRSTLTTLTVPQRTARPTAQSAKGDGMIEENDNTSIAGTKIVNIAPRSTNRNCASSIWRRRAAPRVHTRTKHIAWRTSGFITTL